MSLVLRLKKRDAAGQAEAVAGETMPGVSPPPEPAWDPASFAPAGQSHLAPCPRCGAPNGVSASSCWNCEANLLPLEPFRERRAPMSAAPAALHVPGHVPAFADDSLPVLTSALTDDKPMAGPAMAAVLDSTPAPRKPRRTRETAASILVVAAAAVGLWYLEAPAPPSTVKSGGFVTAPDLAPTHIRPVPTAPADDVGVGQGPPAVAERPTAALRGLAVEPDVSATAQAGQPAATAAWKPTHAGKGRSRSRPPPAEAEVAVPQRPRPDFSSASPSPARPCNPTVAALGLCTAPPVDPKE
jgi:ribosomal protein L40E